MDDADKKRQKETVQRELSAAGLSRRAFLDRLAGLGVGFGAASMLGFNSADAHNAAETLANVESSNPVLNKIIEEGRPPVDDDASQAVAEYGGTPGQSGTGWGGSGSGGGSSYSRGYSRGYSRAYEKYTRYNKYERYARYERYERYTRYERAYTRYSRSSGGGSGGSGPYGGGSGSGGGWGGYGGR